MKRIFVIVGLSVLLWFIFGLAIGVGYQLAENYFQSGGNYA